MMKSQREPKKYEERLPSLPQSSMITKALRAANEIVHGVVHSPMEDVENGCPREDAQPMGTHCSLRPTINRFNEAYYKINHPNDSSQGEILHKETYKVPVNATTIGIPNKEQPVLINPSVLATWESLTRMTLQVANHLDWLIAAAIKILSLGDALTKEQSSDVTGLLASTSTALVHVAHLQTRLLASMCTIRREALLKKSHLEDSTNHFLRSQPIGCQDLFNGQVTVARKADAAVKQEKLIAKSIAPKAQNNPPKSFGNPNQMGNQAKGNQGNPKPQSRRQRRFDNKKKQQFHGQGFQKKDNPSQPQGGAGRGRGRGKDLNSFSSSQAKPRV